MKFTGILIVAVALLAPLYWFLPLAGKHDSVAVFSQYIGVAALVAMGISQLLATKLRVLESIFGGLDRIYVLHKWLGILALSAVLLHDTIDADIDGLGRETALTEIAETFGEFSLYSFLILAVITIATFIPYNVWKLTHKFMGALFALSAFHYVFMIKPFSIWDPLGLYVNAFCVLGILCYLFTLLPFQFLQGRYRYTVQSVEPTGDAVAVTLAPVKKGLRHRPGQFAFVRFDVDGHKEVHPFTISKSNEKSDVLRFTIKPLGGDTHALSRNLKPNTKARVSPAYGHFTRKNSAKPEIWVAGGIGITPFVAFAQNLTQANGPVHLFYCVKNQTNAAHLADLTAIAAANQNFTLHVIESGKQSRLTVEHIEGAISAPISPHTVYFCGPKPMRETLRAGMRAKGLSSRKFKFEEFEIRAGMISLSSLTKFTKVLINFWRQNKSKLGTSHNTR